MVSRFHLLVLGAAALALPPAVIGQKATFLDSFGAPGTGDGQFDGPVDIAFSSDGSVYVTEFNNNRVQRFSAEGAFETKWGSAGVGAGQFNNPTGICKLPGLGDVFVCDSRNNRIQRFSDVIVVAHQGYLGSGNGQFADPYAICHSIANNQIYVVDTLNHRVQRFGLDGSYLGQWGGLGTATGQLKFPRGISSNPRTGKIYVADEDNNRIQRFSPTGAFELSWGSQGVDRGQFNTPRGIEVDGNGLVYVADILNHRIQVFNGTGRFLHQIGSMGGGVGQFMNPLGLAVSGSLLMIADTGNNRIVRYRLSNEAPRLVVKGAKSRAVASSSLRFSGTARDDLKVDFVEVKVGSAPFRKAKGSSKWAFTARGLKPGLNRIQIRAVDLSGRKSKLQILRVSRS